MAYLKIAYVYYIFEDNASSADYARKSLEFARNKEDKKLEDQALCNLFSPLFNMDKLEEAESINEEYYKISKGNRRACFAYLTQKAQVEDARGNHDLDPIPQKMLTQGRRIFEEFSQVEEGA